jgi:hypothetical protein
MTCRELVDMLFDFVAERLYAEHRRSLEEHLGSCPSCTAFVEGYRLTVRLVQRLPPQPLPPSLVQTLQELLQSERKAGKPRLASKRRRGPELRE